MQNNDTQIHASSALRGWDDAVFDGDTVSVFLYDVPGVSELRIEASRKRDQVVIIQRESWRKSGCAYTLMLQIRSRARDK